MTKKTAMSAYARARRDGLIAISLREGDSLIAVRRVKEGERVLMVSSNGKAICWDEQEARPMGRDTMGVKGMSTPDDAQVIGMEVARQGSELFVITANGYGKRTPVGDYPLHHRGGQGVYTIQMTSKKGQLVGMKIIMPGQELMIVSEEGVMIRVKSSDISLQGRNTQGVRVMNVSGNDRVTAVARVATSRQAKPAAGEAGDGDKDGTAEDAGLFATDEDFADKDVDESGSEYDSTADPDFVDANDDADELADDGDVELDF
jgi:DNA gyrase subunit A